MESNQNQASESFAPLSVAAEKILASASGTRVQIKEIKRLTEPGRRNLLLRCFIDPIKDLPASFIIKKVEAKNYNPDDADALDTKRLFNDWVG